MVPSVATAFSAATVVTFRYSVTSPPPSHYPASLSPFLFSTHTFLSLSFILSKKSTGANSLTLLDQWQLLVVFSCVMPSLITELIVPWLRLQWPFFQYRELEWYLIIKMFFYCFFSLYLFCLPTLYFFYFYQSLARDKSLILLVLEHTNSKIIG